MSTVGGHALFAILGPGSGANPESGFGWDRVAPSEHCRCPPTERLCLARGLREAAWHHRRAWSRSAETVLDTRFLKPRMEASTRGDSQIWMEDFGIQETRSFDFLFTSQDASRTEGPPGDQRWFFFYPSEGTPGFS
ncbi:hypothetical protein WMY93_029825 [Mugilogobius chulae]|uniref:Uncharacterized protein n=1 Tax=Mugilogobius chulae TaxID=88201 RepID=A0AAW0MQE9_9GOBI